MRASRECVRAGLTARLFASARHPPRSRNPPPVQGKDHQADFVPAFFAFFSARFSLMDLVAGFFVSFLVSRLFDMVRPPYLVPLWGNSEIAAEAVWADFTALLPSRNP